MQRSVGIVSALVNPQRGQTSVACNVGIAIILGAFQCALTMALCATHGL
jgi:hypothetical protein